MSSERKTAPNALWAYLVQKDLPASNEFSATPVIPSVAPVDRTNTSMRMLIHDMQATLEKFSTRVDTLLISVKDAKAEVANCNRITESEHERVLDEITNSSKKVQTELRACIGTPSQASALELIQKSQTSAEGGIQALDRRIDAIQTLIQSQNHAMQSIQDQQHAILNAVLPLLPLTQAFPLHLDHAKNYIANQVKTCIVDQVKPTIADNISSSMASLSRDIDNIKSTLSCLSVSPNCIRGAPQLALAIPPTPTRKRTNSWLSQEDTHTGRSQPSLSHSFAPARSPPIDRHKKSRLDGVSSTDSPQLVRQSSYTGKYPERNDLESTNAGETTSATGGSVTDINNPLAAPRPKRTTRTSLANILLPDPINNASVRFGKPAVESPPPPGSRAIYTTNIQRTQHESSPPSRRPLPSNGVQMVTSIVSKPDAPITNQKDRTIPKSTAITLPITPQTVSKAIKLEEVLRSPLRGFISLSPSPLSTLSPSPRLVPSRPPLKTQARRAGGGVARRQVTFATSHEFIPSVLSGPGVPPFAMPDSTSASMSLRDRLAQMSMYGRTNSSTKRFITLGSSSDDDDDDGGGGKEKG